MSEKGKILLVEDDVNLGFVIKDNLELAGYGVTHCTDGQSAETQFTSLGSRFDLCILDIMLPKQDGITLANHIRKQNSQVPIIFLSAKSLKEDKVAGFKAGADDYLTKPFSIEELLLRLEAILKRTRQPSAAEKLLPAVMPIGAYQFDFGNRTLTRNGEHRMLTQKEAAVLRMLLQHQNQILTRQEIQMAVWGSDDYFVGRSLDVFISKLRKYLKDDPSIEIANLHGTGFRLMAK